MALTFYSIFIVLFYIYFILGWGSMEHHSLVRSFKTNFCAHNLPYQNCEWLSITFILIATLLFIFFFFWPFIVNQIRIVAKIITEELHPQILQTRKLSLMAPAYLIALFLIYTHKHFGITKWLGKVGVCASSHGGNFS